MDEVIFAEVTAKVSIDFLTVISATIEQHENVFYNVELKSGAKCVQESVGGSWVLRGDLDSINRAYNLMSTIYNLSQLDLMANEVRPGAPGTPSFNHSSEYLEVVRYAANTPVVPSLQDDTDDFRSSDETSIIGGPSSEDVTVAVVNDDVSDRDDLCQRDVSGDEPVCQPMPPSPSQPDDGCKNRRKRGLPRKAIMARLPKKVTLLLSAKELGCEKRCLRPRKPSTIENLEGKDFEANNQKLVKTRTFKRRRDVRKQRHIEDVIKRINRSKMRSYSNSDFSNRSSHRHETVRTSANALSRKAGFVDRDAHEKSDKSVAQFTNYKCPDCGKLFSSLSNLYRHQKVSHSGLRYSCASCGKKFTCRISLQRHERVVHEGLRCDMCQRIFASELQKTDHQCPSHREKSVACQICGSSFSCTSNLNKHVRLLHADDATGEFSGTRSRQACLFCPRKFESVEELANHAHSVHSACSKCGETLVPNLDLSEHLATCFGAGDHSSVTKSQTKHMLRKTVDQPKSRQPINCLHCDKVFSTSSNLRKHIRVIHDNMRFECNVCSRAYACKEQLAQHVAKVHQGLTYKCDLCQEEFKNRLRLAKHQKLIHSHLVVESSYQCEKCGKTFLYKNNLQRHRKHDHEGLRYACRTCEQFFKSRQQAKQHDLVMHQGKNYACLQCAKVFSNLYKLREHETSAHTDLRPHQCAVCGEQFARHSALSYHLQKKHDRSVNVAGELMPQLISNANCSSTQALPDITLASDLAPQAGEIVPHLALDSKTNPDSRSASSNSKEHNTQVFQAVPHSLASTPVSSPAPLITVSPLAYASAPKTPTSSPIACESQKPIDLPHPIVELDVTEVLGEGQVPNMPSSEEVRTGLPDMLTYSSQVDVDNNQNPLLALSDSFSFYDSFSYSPLQSMSHHQGPDLSFFHPSSSSY